MTLMDWITSGLIFAGAGVMLLSLTGTTHVLRMVETGRFLRRWRVLRLLMIFFLAGYLAATAFLAVGLKDILALITGAVFLFGALFVYLVVRVGRDTIEDVQDHARQLQARQEELQAAYEGERRLQEEMAAAQRATAALVTPVIPIAAGVLAMPLIGSIDSERAEQIPRALLREVHRNRAAVVIIDITGVPVLDPTVVKALLDTATSVRLLGAEPVLTGIRAEVAQTMLTAGLDPSRLVVRATLQEGLAYALERTGSGLTAAPRVR